MDANDIGQGRKFASGEMAYDAQMGTYKDSLPAMTTDSKLPTVQMPMAPAPSPFVIKSSATGER
jgi:hypothetical protein